MNQILSVEMPSPKNKRKKNKKINITAIIMFFCIILLIFGVLMIGMGIYSKIKESNKNDSEYVKSKPKIEIIPKMSKLEVTITSEKEIAKISYKWNNGEEKTVNGTGESKTELELTIPLGSNILSITATDVEGVSETFEREYIGYEEYKPKSVKLIYGENSFKLICESDTVIKQISYYYDEKAEALNPINDVKGEVLIDAMPGKHILTIVITDEKDRQHKEEHNVYVPEINIGTDGDYFIIRVNDTRGLTKISKNFNDEESQKEISGTEYEERVELKRGENKIIVKVTNTDGITYTKKVRWKK